MSLTAHGHHGIQRQRSTAYVRYVAWRTTVDTRLAYAMMPRFTVVRGHRRVVRGPLLTTHGSAHDVEPLGHKGGVVGAERHG